MKVKIIPSDNRYEWEIEIIQGSQSFRLKYEGTKSECQWYARMFRKALKTHDNEQKSRASKA